MKLVLAALCTFFAMAGAPRSFAQEPAGKPPAHLAPKAAPKKTPPGAGRTVNNPLNDLLDEAQSAIDKNDFSAAVPPLQKFIAEKPDVAYAHFQLAFAFTGLQRTDEARDEYKRAIELDPKMAEAHLNLGTLLLNHDSGAAVVPLRKAVELLASQSRPRYLLGVALERSGDVKGATEAFAGALALDPKDFDTTLHLGGLYYNAKRPGEAAARFRAALELQPNAPAALLGLAQSLDADGKPEAVDAYRAYLKVKPDDGAARSRLVHVLVEKQEFDGALAELDAASGGQAATIESLKLRADIQIGQKKWSDAAATLQQAVTAAPNDAKLHGGLGRIQMQLRDYAAAEKELKAALQLDRNNIVFWKDLASTYYLSGNYATALTVMDVVAKVETPGPGAWFIRAICYDKLQQRQPALDAYQKFLELDGNKNPDQVFQAEQRSKVLRRLLEQKK